MGGMNETPYLSVILPCRNQADHIRAIIESYYPALDTIGQPYELVVVPNACTDATVAVVLAMMEQERRIRVEESPLPGWGRAVLAGLRCARGELLCYSNSARTDPARIPPLVDVWRQNPSCIVKVCRIQRKAFLREIGSLLYNLEGRLLLGTRSGDVNGTPKLFSRPLCQRLDLRCEDDLLDMELMAKARRLGVQTLEIPVPGFRRHGGKSSTTLASAWKMYAGVWRLRGQLARCTL
jgi:glycosyltransferase involved in cell wall biosynthesis